MAVNTQWDPDAEGRMAAYKAAYEALDLRRGPRTAGRDVDITLSENVHDRAVECVALVAAQNKPESVFVRGGRLAQTQIDDEGRATFVDLGDHRRLDELAAMLARRINFRRITKSNHIENRPPPADVVRAVRVLGEYHDIPVCDGIVSTPVMLPTGALLIDPGYHAEARLLHWPDPSLDLYLKPGATREDARAAGHRLISEVLVDFPFADASDRANALALLLTPLIRHAVDLVPMAIVTAPIKGSGKGLLAHLSSTIAAGREAGVYAFPDDENEVRKAIDGMLLQGQQFVFLDEVTELRSRHLAAVLTSTRPDIRMLGRSDMFQVPQRATWVAAGNNISVAGDMDRRSYRIRLDPKTSQPWLRNGFRHPNLLEHARANRGLYLSDLLTMAMVWWNDGKPAPPDPVRLGSFGDWARTVGGILHHAGIEGFLGNQTEHYSASDADADEWDAFLARALILTSGQEFTVGRLCGLLDSDGELRALLPGDLVEKHGQKAFTRNLGHALGRRKGTRHGDRELHLAEAGKDRTKTNQWRILEGRRGELMTA